MKSLHITIAGILLMGTSCTKNLTGLNSNPEAPLTAPSASVFLAGEKALADLYSSDSWSESPFRVVAQVWTQNTYNNEAHYNFSINNSPGGWWTALYTNALSNLAQAKVLYSNDVADVSVRRNDLIITDILEVYSYHLLVNTYGNVPYSQALNRNIPFPAYDDAKTVEFDLIHRLDTAIAGLNPSYGSLGAADQLYAGNVTQWKKFAASLELKLALLVADSDPDTASVKVKAALAAGVFSSASDDALLTYDASAVVNSSPIWQDLVNGNNLHYYSPAAYFINTLSDWNDPRLPLMFTTDPSGQYSGGIAGAGNSSVDLSSFSALWLGATFPADLLDYSETEFLQAEAIERGLVTSGTAQAHYDSAVAASVRFWVELSQTP